MVLDLHLSDIAACSSLSSNLLNTYREAAEVLLDQFHEHRDNALDALICEVDTTDQPARVHRGRPTASQRASHSNRIDATEFAACAVAIVAVFHRFGYRVIGRAPHGSGADFLMRRAEDRGDEFLRLEVSGISGAEAPRTRLRAKLTELREGSDRRPGRAVVVRFPDVPLQIVTEAVS